MLCFGDEKGNLLVLNISRPGLLSGACVAACLASHGASAAGFADPMVSPAVFNPAPATEPLIAVARAGDHLVAVGPRGEIILSDASLTHWHQVAVPVESDLVAVDFPDAQNGWVCGHNGVILHSTDGGNDWQVQLTGVAAQKMFEADYNRDIAAGNQAIVPFLQEIQMNFDPGPTLPWLGIWFADATHGFTVGAFGDIAVTQDGGKTWTPWLEHIANPGFLDLDTVTNIGGQIYVTGEQGSVFRYDPKTQNFISVSTTYEGSIFGLTGTARTLIAYGLRGTVFRSEDQGKHWTQSADPSDASIMAGSVLPDGRIALVNVDGGLLISTDDGLDFSLSPHTGASPLTDVIPAGGARLVLTGLGGITDALVPGGPS